jgi:uncharacterized protein
MKHLTDLTATLSVEDQARMEAQLRAFEDRKGSQLAVLIVPTTQPEAIEQYSLRVAEQWKLGRKKVDDGVILIVAKDDRALRIEVGYGLEGVLNDATAKRIISEVIVPRFKAGDYPGGISAGVEQMMRVVDGEALPDPERHSSARTNGFSRLLPVVAVVAVVLGGALRAMFGRLPAALVTGGVVGVVSWFMLGTAVMAGIAAVIGFMFTLTSGGLGRGGVWMGGGRGGGGGGGFSGGGGGFGGGGASGRW